MAERISLGELVGDTGSLFYRGKYGFCTGAEPLQQLGLTEAGKDGTHVWGKLDVSGSLWKQYGFLQQIAVTGKIEEGGYTLFGTVQVPSSFVWLPGECREWRFFLKAERKQQHSLQKREGEHPVRKGEGERPVQKREEESPVRKGENELQASVFLETELMISWMGQAKGQVFWKLFSEDAWIPLQIKFFNEKGEPGAGVEQCLSAFESLLGASADVSGFLPEKIPFQSAVKLYGVSYGYSMDGTYRVKSAAVDFGFENAKANLQLQTGICSLEEIRFLMGLSREKGNELFGSICVNLTLFGQPLSVLAEYPGFRIRIDIPFRLALQEAANALKLSLPKEFKEGKVDHLFLETALDFSDFSVKLRLTDLVKLPLLGNTVFCLEETDFTVEKQENGLTVGLEGLLSLYENTDRLTGFYAGVEFGQQGMELTARLTEPADFFRILKALTGACPVTGFTIALTRMELYGSWKEGFALRQYRAAGELAVTDAGIFGMPFAFMAEVEGNTKCVKFSGSFTLGELFQVEAEVTIDGDPAKEAEVTIDGESAKEAEVTIDGNPAKEAGDTAESAFLDQRNRESKWIFMLVLKKLRISLTYDSKSQTVSGKIESDFLLEDCVSWFLSLLNPEETYTPNSNWSFLMGINLKGLTLSYSHKKKEVSIGWKPSFSIPFGSFQEITLIAGPAGVRFEAQGDFLGETYGEENPLSWEPNHPPETTGKLLQLHYFLLSDSLLVEDLDPGDLKKAVAKLEERITGDTDPASLELSEESGYLAALDCDIADMVECRLLYNEKASLYGANFRLYGEKAAGLAGLEAELAYGKVDDTVGMFHVRFVPPEKKEFQLGAIRLGLGCVDAKVYTNGNFYIDIGFPKNRNFDTSFAFRYGAFGGRGGMYLTQGAYGADSLLPKPETGYFDHVIGAGLGVRLELGKSFRAGILSASALLVLQGILEGIYAVYEPNEKGKPSVPFYRLSAWVNLDGVLTGSVDFGIIGASVSLHINTQLSFVMQACERVYANVELTIEASARVKILFVTIKFGFSLHYKAEFTFAEASDAPWKSRRLEGEGTENSEERDLLPLCWKLPRYKIERGINSGAEIRSEVPKVFLKAVPVFGGNVRGEEVSTLFLLADIENFAILMELLMQTMTENGYLNRIGTMELFDGRRIFSEPRFLDRLLEENVVLEISFPGIFYEQDALNSAEAGRNLPGMEASEEGMAVSEELKGAFLPLPEFLITSLVSVYEDGTEKRVVSDLSQMQMIDDTYIEENDRYYKSTTEHTKVLNDKNGDGTRRSMQSWLWQDYWELLIKAIRAQKESAALTRREFRCENAEASQTEELAGIANAFLLAGKRGLRPGQQAETETGLETNIKNRTNVLYSNQQTETAYVDSIWQLSGAGQLLDRAEHVKDYRYELEKTEDAPKWFTFAEGSKKLVCELAKSDVEPKLPQGTLPEQTFSGEVTLSPAWTKEDAPSIRRNPMIRTELFGYCSAGEGFTEDIAYQKEDGSPADFCILLKVGLLRVNGEPALYRITEYRDFTKLKAYFTPEQKSRAREISLLWEEEYSDCYVVRGAGRGAGKVFARSCDPEGFLSVLYQAFREEAPLFLGFERGKCPLPSGRDLEINLAVKLVSEGIFHGCMNGVYGKASEEQLVLWPKYKVWRQRIAQGSLEANWNLDFTGIPEKDIAIRDSLAGGAGEITDSNGVVLSHETPPFLKEGDGENQRYRVRMPYAQALAQSAQTDCYAWIKEKREFHMSVFLLNLTGGRIETGKYAAFVPKYQDALLAPGAWPGIRVSSRIEDGTWQMWFYGAGEQQEQLSEVLHQLKQPDVTIRLSGTLLAEERDCKPEIVEFLEGCQKEPDKEHDWMTEVSVKDYETPQFAVFSCVLTIERDKNLVASDTPPEVSGIQVRIPLEKVCAENISSNKILFMGTDSNYLLTDCSFLQPGEMQYFALRPFSDISGAYQEGEETLQLQSFSLQSAVELFEEDLTWLGLPAQMTALYEDDVSGGTLERFYELRQEAAKALASQVCPVFEGTKEQTKQAMDEYVVRLASEGRILSLRNMLFFGQEMVGALDRTEAEWTLKGTVLDKNYPIYLPVTEKEIRLCGAIDAGERRVDFSEGNYLVSDACRGTEEEWFTAPEGGMEIPLSCQDAFRKPSLEKVPVPVVLAREEGEQEIILTLELCPKGGDILRLEEAGKPEGAAEPGRIPVFYHYALESGKLRGQNTKESRAKLLEWMSRFAKALQGFVPEPPVVLEGLSLIFQAKEGSFEKISLSVSKNEDVTPVKIEVFRNGTFVLLEQQEWDYFFPEGGLETEGERLRLRITLSASQDFAKSQENFLYRMAMERPQRLESNVTRQISRVFVLQSEVCFL